MEPLRPSLVLIKKEGISDEKTFFIGTAVVLLLLSACSDEAGRFSISMLPEDIDQVTVAHHLSGETDEWTIEGDALENWKSWLDSLSAQQKSFEEGRTPGDVDGGEVYTFDINSGEQDVSYVINGDEDHYLMFSDEWYVISNPADRSQFPIYHLK